MSRLTSKIKTLAKFQKIRFLLVGGFNTFLGYGLFVVFHLLTSKYLGYIGALLVAHSISSSVAYFLYSRIVFPEGDRGSKPFFKFQSVYILPLMTNILALPVLIELINCPPLLAQAVFSVSWVAVSFVAHRDFSFRQPKKETRQP